MRPVKARTIGLCLIAVVLAGGGTVSRAIAQPASGPAVTPTFGTVLLLTGRVVDAADILYAQQQDDLTTLSTQLERATRVQFVVATTPSLGRRDIAEYATTLSNALGVG